MEFATRAGIYRATALLGLFAGSFVVLWFALLRMPGDNYSGPTPALDAAGQKLSRQLESDVRYLSETIGHRTFWDYSAQRKAQEWIQERLESSGLAVSQLQYEIEDRTYANVIGEIPGSSDSNESIIVGAHFDTALGAGADDNASGVALLLALAQEFSNSKPQITLRFVAFPNEEPPSFWSDQMGSLVYAKALRERGENVRAMLSLESLGYYTQEPRSQKYPPPFSLFYPSVGNFVAFVGNPASKELTRKLVGTFRQYATFPSEGAALPSDLTVFGKEVGLQGVGWSDHWSFWQVGYPAVMVTDTATFRNPNYHQLSDTPETIDYEAMVLVYQGLRHVIADLSGIPQSP